MKTFEQYIREAVDFRLGGSANKGKATKSFKDLEGGDYVYFYEIDRRKRSASKTVEGRIKRVKFETIEKENIKILNIFYINNLEKGPESYTFISEENFEKDMYAFEWQSMYAIWSTFDMTEEEALGIINDPKTVIEK